MNGRLVEQTRMRAAIARRMSESKQQIPHFYVQTEVTVDAALKLLAQLNADAAASRITMTVALVRACAVALRAEPRFNSVWTPDGLIEVDEINVGVAISLDDGLVAPALLSVDTLSLAATRDGLRDLGERARAGRLRAAEMTGATFTLSNLGMFDVSAFTAIVTPPQVAILATGRAVERFVLTEQGPERRSVLTATLSADHRAVDGVDAARFVQAFKTALESPETVLADAGNSTRDP